MENLLVTESIVATRSDISICSITSDRTVCLLNVIHTSLYDGTISITISVPITTSVPIYLVNNIFTAIRVRYSLNLRFGI